MANDKDNTPSNPAADAATSVIPRSSGVQREAFINALGQAVLEVLSGGPPQSSAEALAEPHLSQPISAEKFSEALTQLNEAGWKFDTSYPVARLIPSKSEMSEESWTSFNELRKEHPLLPYEVAEVVLSALTGNLPDSARIANQEELRDKQAVVERYVITDSLREEFFLRD